LSVCHFVLLPDEDLLLLGSYRSRFRCVQILVCFIKKVERETPPFLHSGHYFRYRALFSRTGLKVDGPKWHTARNNSSSENRLPS
jgi:hypothetical protein